VLTSCRGGEGAYELPRGVGEASGPLKILRNCLFPTQDILLVFWVLIVFEHLYILGGSRKLSKKSKTNMASCVVVF
jgi:hypothetical protein